MYPIPIQIIEQSQSLLFQHSWIINYKIIYKFVLLLLLLTSQIEGCWFFEAPLELPWLVLYPQEHFSILETDLAGKQIRSPTPNDQVVYRNQSSNSIKNRWECWKAYFYCWNICSRIATQPRTNWNANKSR